MSAKLLLVFLSAVLVSFVNGQNSEENDIPSSEISTLEVETDYLKPTKCQDPDTGELYKLGSEWYEIGKCQKRLCESRHFPLVRIIRCEEYCENSLLQRYLREKDRDSQKARFGRKFPHCCPVCKNRPPL